MNNQKILKYSFDKKINTNNSFIKQNIIKKCNKNSYVTNKEIQEINEDNCFLVSFDDTIKKNIVINNPIKDFEKKCPIRVNKKDIPLYMSNRKKYNKSHDYIEKKSSLNFVKNQNIDLYLAEKENNNIKINKQFSDKNIKNKNKNEKNYDIHKLKIIQHWWKKIIKINTYHLRNNNFFKIILKFFYIHFINRLKYSIYCHKIKNRFFNKWLNITNKKLIIRKIINKKKENKCQNKNTNDVLIKKIQKLKYIKKIEKCVKHKAINLNNIYNTKNTKTNFITSSNNATKSLIINNSNFSLNKKVKSMRKKDKNTLLNLDTNKYTTIKQCHSYSTSITNTCEINKKLIKIIKMNNIPLSNRNISPKIILKKYSSESNAKIYNNNNKIVFRKIPNSVLPSSSSFTNHVTNKNKIQIRRKKNNSIFSDNSMGKLIISFTGLNNENLKKSNSINNSRVNKIVRYDSCKTNFIRKTNEKKIFKTERSKNTKKYVKELKKNRINNFNSNPNIIKMNNNDFKIIKLLKKFFYYWLSKSNKKQILEKLIQFIKNKKIEKIKKYFIKIGIKLIKYTVVKIFNTITLLKNFKVYQNIVKTLKLKMIILQKIKIYFFNKNKHDRFNYDNILKKSHNTIGETTNANININKANHKTNFQIINSNENLVNKIKKNRSASSNIISKIIQINKINNSTQSNKIVNKRTYISNYTNNLDNFFIENNQRSEKLNKKNSEFSDKQIYFYDNNNINLVEQFEKIKGDRIAQINQLKMVFNLLEQHEILKNYDLSTCFNHWKKLISMKKRKIKHKIDEKIILFKSNRLSNKNTSPFLSFEYKNKCNSSIFYRSSSMSMPGYNITDNNDKNKINNIYINSGQNNNEKYEIMQEKNNIHIHKMIYQKKKLYSSNYNIIQVKNNNNYYNPQRLVFRDISNLINHNYKDSFSKGTNNSTNDLRNNFENFFYDKRFNLYNINTNNNIKKSNEFINIKKEKKIEEREIYFAKSKKK